MYIVAAPVIIGASREGGGGGEEEQKWRLIVGMAPKGNIVVFVRVCVAGA